MILKRIGNDIKRQKKSYLIALVIACVVLVCRNYYLSTTSLESNTPPFLKPKVPKNVPFEVHRPKKPFMPLPENPWLRQQEWKDLDDVSLESEAKLSQKINLNEINVTFAQPIAQQCNTPLPAEPHVQLEAQDMWTGKSAGQSFMPTSKMEQAKQDKLKVFVVPHSHSDPGWLLTFDEYSRDTNMNLDLMLKFMPEHPRMTFQFSETSFFEKWWSRLTQEQKTAVKKLTKNGQFELPNGAWTMTDEANPYYQITIDNMIEGHQYLWNELQYRVPTVWTNDPFGFGPTNAYFFRKAGVKFHVIHRVHREVKHSLFAKKAIPFLWEQHFDAKGDARILTHVLSGDHYDIPGTCGPRPDVCCQFDFKRLTNWGCGGGRPQAITESNVKQRSEMILQQWKQLANKYRAPNIALVMLGDDFRYKDEREWYQQHDNYVKIFDYINSHPELNTEAKFGTIGEYWAEFMKRVNDDYSQYPTLAGDFFPYTDTGGDYWTGYFTSRPFNKRRDRQVWSRIQAADTALAWLLTHTPAADMPTNLIKQMHEKLTNARRNLAVFQHHDAITGTSKKHVARDYGQLLHQALTNANEVISLSTTGILTPKLLKAAPPSVPDTNHYQRDTVTHSKPQSQSFVLTEQPTTFNTLDAQNVIQGNAGKTISITLYNPLPYARRDPVKMHISNPNVEVLDLARGAAPVPAQINPVIELKRKDVVATDVYELVFFPMLLPMSLHQFSIVFRDSLPSSTSLATVTMTDSLEVKIDVVPSLFNAKRVDPQARKITLRTSRLLTEHDVNSGLIQNISSENYGQQRLSVSFHQYQNAMDGPYLFMPNKQQPDPITTDNALAIVVQGALMACSHTFLTRIQHITCIHDVPGAPGELHMSNTVDMSQMGQNEFVVRLKTQLELPDRVFYTDSLGFQFIKRKWVQRPIQANYYPMPAAAALEDQNSRMTVLVDHPHGVTQPEKGVMEIMLDRVSHRDDRKGLGGGEDGLMTDAVPVTSKYTVVIEKRSTPPDLSRHAFYHSPVCRLALRSLLDPPLSMTHGSATTTTQSVPSVPQMSDNQGGGIPVVNSDALAVIKTLWPLKSAVQNTLPCDYEIITLRAISGDPHKWLLVLHRAAVDCELTKAATKGELYCDRGEEQLKSVLTALLKRLGVTTMQETSLNGVDLIGKEMSLESIDFRMSPMDIRTFKFQIQFK